MKVKIIVSPSIVPNDASNDPGRPRAVHGVTKAALTFLSPHEKQHVPSYRHRSTHPSPAAIVAVLTATHPPPAPRSASVVVAATSTHSTESASPPPPSRLASTATRPLASALDAFDAGGSSPATSNSTATSHANAETAVVADGAGAVGSLASAAARASASERHPRGASPPPADDAGNDAAHFRAAAW